MKQQQINEKGKKQERYKTRLMTLNVYSIANKLQAVEHYLKTNRVHIAVITETHIQQGDPIDIQIKDYVLASTCKRKKGSTKGGIAIYVHISIPHQKKEERMVQTQNEIEHCSVVILPNHNQEDKLAVVGVYRPPGKEHPDYTHMLKQMLRYNKEQRITTVIMGDLNINSWGKQEKNFYQEWIESENLWELSDPRTPTYRTGTVTDGILLAMGDYHPEGILPQVADPELDGGYPGAYPVFVSKTTVLVDRHALFLDIITMELR